MNSASCDPRVILSNPTPFALTSKCDLRPDMTNVVVEIDNEIPVQERVSLREPTLPPIAPLCPEEYLGKCHERNGECLNMRMGRIQERTGIALQFVREDICINDDR